MLVVEDNEGDVLLIRDAIEAVNLGVTVDVVQDGEQAVRLFDRLDANSNLPCPSLVILDINLPRLEGSEVLKHLRQSQRCRDSVVLATSTSDSARDRQQMTELGANSYFKKPSEYDAFMKLGDLVKTLLAGNQPK